jgi:DNA-directed RNA polymerase
MMLTVQAMSKGKAVSWAVVHDSFACHAADAPRLATTIREKFVEMYEGHDMLAEFKRDIERDTGLVLPDPPPRGSLDITEVLKSDFFFA